jgi:hypothetical protein
VNDLRYYDIPEFERIDPRDFQVGDWIVHSTWYEGATGHEVTRVNRDSGIVDLRLYGSDYSSPMHIDQLIYSEPTWFWMRKKSEVSEYDPTQMGDTDDDI